MQNWFNLSVPQAEDSLYDIESIRRFAGTELMGHDIPDESTILRFRHLLEQHQLTELILAEIRSLLEQKRLLLKSGTIVDATIIAAPPSTNNEQKARDPEMHQSKKGKDWHFGMKAHIGTDRRGVVHSLSTTARRCPNCCTEKSERCSAIKPTGMSRIARLPLLPDFVTESIGAPRASR
jgi:IS5 family transposase